MKIITKIWQRIQNPFRKKKELDPCFELLLEYMDFLWTDRDDSLIKLCRMLCCSSNFRNLATPSALLIAISALLEDNDFSNARSLLELYMKKYGMADIEEFPQVSNFVQKIFKCKEKIKTSASVFIRLKNIEICQNLSVFKDRSIAVVGNGPSQIGKATGPEIDRHDIVIRFNDFSTDKKYSADYGTKTTIWSVNRSSIKQENYHMCQYSIIFTGILKRLNYQHIEELEYFLNNTNIIYVVPDYVRQTLKTESQIVRPTSGLLIVYWLKKFVGVNLNVYGFTHLKSIDEDIITENSHHYYDDGHSKLLFGTIHHHDKEAQFLSDFLQR